MLHPNPRIITFCLISSIYIGVVPVFTFWFLADLLENHRPHEHFISKKFKYVSPKNKITLSYIISVPLLHPRSLKLVYYYLIT